VNELALGTRGHTDLLSLSLSTTDKIGHTYGPDSREMHDHLLRLDRWFGTFLDSLGAIVPRQRTVVVLTADHGMTSFPEYVVSIQHEKAGRMSLTAKVNRVIAELRDRCGATFDLRFDNGILTADTAALRHAGVNVDSLAHTFAVAARALPGVARVYTRKELAAARASDENANRWKRNLPPSVGWLIVTVAMPHFVFSDKMTGEHGTMQPETVRVPIAFMGAGIQPRTYQRVVRSVDIAPTLARLLAIAATEPLDGAPIAEVRR
jgi:arylsulfatase A-like enzyme